MLIIDLQKGVDNPEGSLYNLKNVLKNVNLRIDCYRKKKLPIILIQHEDEDLIANSENWLLMRELDCRDQDSIVSKTHANSFYKTKLQEQLKELGVSELEICGAQTEYCVDTTIKVAHGLGYKCFMCKGLSTTADTELLSAKELIKHYEAIWNNRFLTFID